eukprot:scaffold650_cov407-Prasinococcus_capsulatus_cf.AAC.48
MSGTSLHARTYLVELEDISQSRMYQGDSAPWGMGMALIAQHAVVTRVSDERRHQQRHTANIGSSSIRISDLVTASDNAAQRTAPPVCRCPWP